MSSATRWRRWRSPTARWRSSCAARASGRSRGQRRPRVIWRVLTGQLRQAGVERELRRMGEPRATPRGRRSSRVLVVVGALTLAVDVTLSPRTWSASSVVQPSCSRSSISVQSTSNRNLLEARGHLAARLPAPGRPRGDRGARKVPYLDEVVRKLIALGYERALRACRSARRSASAQDQLPGIWVLHRQVFNVLDWTMSRTSTSRSSPRQRLRRSAPSKPIVVLNSELVRLLDDDGRRVVLAHEAAHVHSDHVLYQTALLILLRLGLGVRCRCSPACRCSRSGSRCSSGPRGGAGATAPPRSSRRRPRSAAR